MPSIKNTRGYNPIKYLQLENDEELIKGLAIVHLFRNEYSPNKISKAIAIGFPDLHVDIRANDVKAIFAYLEANSNDDARLKAMAACNIFGDDISEVQLCLKDWDVWVTMAERKQRLQVRIELFQKSGLY